MRRTVTLLTALVVTAVATSGCAKAHGSKEAFCTQLRKTPAIATALAGYPSGDASSYVEQLHEARDAFGELQKAAPRSIRADVGSVGALVDDIVRAIEKNPDDPTAVAGQLRMQMLSSPSSAKSALNVGNYATKECGVALNPVGAVPPSFGVPSTSSLPPTLSVPPTSSGTGN